MRKFFLLLAALFVIPVFSSNLYVYNNLNDSLYYIIGAQPSSGNSHPFLYSRGPYTTPSSLTPYFVLLGPTNSTTYSNATGFPFNSPSTLPATAQVSNWVRQLTPISSWINTSNTLAQSMFGNTHRFSEFKFFVKDEFDNVIESGNIDPVNLDQPLEIEGTEILTTYFPIDGDVFILFDYLP